MKLPSWLFPICLWALSSHASQNWHPSFQPDLEWQDSIKSNEIWTVLLQPLCEAKGCELATEWMLRYLDVCAVVADRHLQFAKWAFTTPHDPLDSSLAFLQEWQITFSPAIIFVQKRMNPLSTNYTIHVTEYKGPTPSSEELVGLQHYWTRLPHGRLPLSPTTRRNPLTWYVEDFAQLQDFLHGPIFQSTPTPLDPRLSDDEKAWVHDLLQEEQYPEPFWLMVQCPAATNTTNNEFEHLSTVLSARHNVLFAILQTQKEKQEDGPCSNPGAVFVYNVLPKNESEQDTWSLQLRSILPAQNTTQPAPTDQTQTRRQFPVMASLSRDILNLLRPTILWMDRQMSAPIAFSSLQYDDMSVVHAVLVIDFHTSNEINPRSAPIQKTMQEFRKVCQQYRQEPTNMICLVVPSTETRILTTFGIDIWSALEQDLPTSSTQTTKSESARKSVGYPLPALFLTHQTSNGLQRYYLDPPQARNATALETFVQQFWNHELEPELKSSLAGTTPSMPHTNRHQVAQLSAQWWSQADLWAKEARSNTTPQRQPVLLLMLYTPTCGHCKRFHLLWNTLGELVHYLDWDHWLLVGSLDVSANEWALPPRSKGTSVPPLHLPSVYSWRPQLNPPDTPLLYSHPTRQVGSMSDPLEILEWVIEQLVEREGPTPSEDKLHVLQSLLDDLTQAN